MLVGGAGQPTLVQSLGAGRALLCNDRRCDVWDQATGAWTPTQAVVLPLNTLSYLRRRDGAVVAIDGARKIASAIWSPTTGQWTPAAALPEPLNQLKTAQIADGRIIAVGQWRGLMRAYVADSALRSWSRLVDSPEGLSNPQAIPTGSGILLFADQRVWRHTVGVDGWREISVSAHLSGKSSWLMEWADQVLIVLPDKGEARLMDRGGDVHPTAALPSRTGLGFDRIATADAAAVWAVHAGTVTWLWRRPDEDAIPIPTNPIDWPYQIIAVDDSHLLGVGISGAVSVLALDGGVPPARPCDGLARYLAQTLPPMPPVSELALVSLGCREQVRRGQAPEFLALVKSWTSQPDRAESGRALLCALQDTSAIGVLPRWLEENERHHSRTVCYQSLASWPAAEAVWQPALESAVRKHGGAWFVDPAVTALAVAVPTGEVRERLVPTLRIAAQRHAAGFDALRDRVCVPDPTASVARRQTCAGIATQHEAEWRRTKAEADAKPASPLPKVQVATAVLAGAVGATYAARNSDAGRGIATTAGAIGGAALGVSLTGLAVFSSRGFGPGADKGEGALVLFGALAGGVLGGIASYAASNSPSHRAPATAVGLAVPYAVTLVVLLN